MVFVLRLHSIRTTIKKCSVIQFLRCQTLLYAAIIHGWTAAKETKTKWQPFIDLLVEQGFAVTFLALAGIIKTSGREGIGSICRGGCTQSPKHPPVITIGHRLVAKLPPASHILKMFPGWF